jgi:opacity protein-like surface antigen
MKKLAVLVVLLAVLSVSAFAAPAFKISAGVGGFYQKYKTEYSSSNTIADTLVKMVNNNYAGWGFYGFLDVGFLEANAGLAYGTHQQPYFGSSRSLTSLNLAAYLKYPIALGPVTIFPLAGADYNILLSGKVGTAQFERSDLPSGDETQYDAFFISAGGGLDIQITPNLFIRGELRWGFKLKNKWEDDDITISEALLNTDISFRSTGPKITLALGYSL